MVKNIMRSFLNRCPAWFLIFTVILAGCSPFLEDAPPFPGVIEGKIPSAQATISIQTGDSYTPTGLLPGDNLLVYSGPSQDSPVVGEIPIGAAGITINERSLEGKIPWVKIDFNKLTGWVDYKYLARYKGDLPEELILLGYQTLAALREMDADRINGLIHPDLCLRISPYPYLADTNQSICPGELRPLLVSEEVHTWGNYDGTGEAIQLSFIEYYRAFIYDSDYIQAPMVGFDVEISSGNSINNIPELFPDGKMIEYHFPGFDPKYGGMDWRSIRLVFVKFGENWYLGAIIHGEWTI
jgi:hypothetical protein